jgi:hypothetical protein
MRKRERRGNITNIPSKMYRKEGEYSDVDSDTKGEIMFSHLLEFLVSARKRQPKRKENEGNEGDV